MISIYTTASQAKFLLEKTPARPSSKPENLHWRSEQIQKKLQGYQEERHTYLQAQKLENNIREILKHTEESLTNLFEKTLSSLKQQQQIRRDSLIAQECFLNAGCQNYYVRQEFQGAFHISDIFFSVAPCFLAKALEEFPPSSPEMEPLPSSKETPPQENTFQEIEKTIQLLSTLKLA